MLALLLPALLVGFGLVALIGDDDDDAAPETGTGQTGGPGSDTLEGSAGDDLLDGRVGDDTLSGAGGDDTLIGGSGVDLLDGGAGRDALDGGNGDDVLFGGSGADELRGGDGDDALIGEAGDDELRGNEGDDGLYGSAGNDTLFGNEGEDVLYGIDVIDEALLTPEGILGVVGEETFEEFVDVDADPGEADTLNGGRDDDVLLVGSADTAIGGGGADIFALGDWVTPNAPATITDFDPAQDSIVYAYEGQVPPAVSFAVNEDDAEQVNLLVDGAVVAVLSNVELTSLDPGAVSLVVL